MYIQQTGQVWNQQRSNLALGGYEKIPDVV